MNFEEAGRTVDEEVKRFVKYLEEKVRPSTRHELAELLRKASAGLEKLAASFEKP